MVTERRRACLLILKENLGLQAVRMEMIFKKNMGLCSLPLQGLEHDEKLIESEF